MVLPSIVRNLLLPNARHNCDVNVHYYRVFAEAGGRRNPGGAIDPDAVLLLEEAAKDVAMKQHRPGTTSSSSSSRFPYVAFRNETDVQFWEQRNASLYTYHNTLKKNGKPKYFPYKAITYLNSSIDNIVRQWHSIEGAFQ